MQLKVNTLRTGFEQARKDPNGFQVHRLNHSAIAADSESSWNICYELFSNINLGNLLQNLCCAYIQEMYIEKWILFTKSSKHTQIQ